MAANNSTSNTAGTGTSGNTGTTGTSNTASANTAGASTVEGATVGTSATAGTGNAKTTKASAKDARAAAEQTEKQIKKLSVGDSLEVAGPYDPNSGAQVFRFNRLNANKEPIDILPGQTLKVGGNDGDVTKEEAEILLRNESWEFKRK